MKNCLDQPITRRAWMVLAGTALTGCGGGGNLLAALPGTGGTGAVFAQGVIAGFGSVIVNGTKFDDQLATVTLDGAAGSSGDLRLGMVAEIKGQRSATAALGTASSIEVWTIAQGQVTALVSGGFVLAGMTILCDTATALDGMNSLTELALDDTLVVWGLPKAADARTWTATRVSRVDRMVWIAAGATVVSSGNFQMHEENPMLNGMHLVGNAMASMTVGTWVRVEGSLTAPSTLTVNAMRVLGVAPALQSDDGMELEGYVTAITSSTRFMLGLTEVDASALNPVPIMTVGDRIEVYGSWSAAGVMVASSVNQQSETQLHASEITGIVTAFVSVADFVVRGEHCDASQAVFSHGTAADLRQNVLVKVEGTRDGAMLKVLSLEFED